MQKKVLVNAIWLLLLMGPLAPAGADVLKVDRSTELFTLERCSPKICTHLGRLTELSLPFLTEKLDYAKLPFQFESWSEIQVGQLVYFEVPEAFWSSLEETVREFSICTNPRSLGPSESE